METDAPMEMHQDGGQMAFVENTGNVMILCCMCGVQIQSNPANMCLNCLKQQVDITEGIQKEVIIHYCKQCGRYLRPPWLFCELESKELLSLCLKKIRGLNKTKIVDARFVWTEPHSKRLKVSLTVQKEAVMNMLLQQTFVVEFVVHYLQCDACKKTFTPHLWVAACQLRQKVAHKKTFMLLEQLILKHNAQDQCVNIKEMSDGIDFYFANKAHCMRMVDFIGSMAPIKVKTAKELIGHDTHTNAYNYKFTFSVEIAPVCGHDLVLVPPKVQQELGGHGPVLLCLRVTTNFFFLDPARMHLCEIGGSNYFKNEFSSIATQKNLTEFVVLDVSEYNKTPLPGSKFVVAEMEVARANDFSTTFTVYSHLGAILNPGDSAWGYDMNSMVQNEMDRMMMENSNLPEVILIKKKFTKRKSKRLWKLKKLDKEAAKANNVWDRKKGGKKRQGDKEENDEDGFLEDIEEDPELRAQIPIYKDENAIAERVKKMKEGTLEAEDENAAPEIDLVGLMEDLEIKDTAVEENEETVGEFFSKLNLDGSEDPATDGNTQGQAQ